MKFLFMGDRDTGKTTVANMMCQKYNEVLMPTIGMQFHTSASHLHKIWDLSGDKTSENLRNAVTNDCQAIVYFCTDQKSFDSIKNFWYVRSDKRKYMVVKCQPTLEMKSFASDNKIKFILTTCNQTSAKILAEHEWSKTVHAKPWCCFPFLYRRAKKYDRLLVPS